jgi:hypothetical protein
VRPESQKQTKPDHEQDSVKRKPEACVNRNQEIEKIKRQLHSLIDRLEALKTK